MIIGITGSFCAGKDTVAKYLQEKHGFGHVSLSDLIREELKQKNIPITRENLQDYANKVRANQGHSYFAEKALKKIDKTANFVVTSIRHPAEVKALQQDSSFFLVFVDAPTAVRFKRMQSRTERKEDDAKTLKEFVASENKEMAKSGPGQQLGECKKLAKIVLNNESTEDKLSLKVDNIVKDIFIKFIKSGRPSKEEYYLQIAEEVAARSNCLSSKFGAIIVREDQIISTGYNGAPRKTRDCIDRGSCLRREIKVPSGHRYELCRSVHAEQNALVNAARAGVSLLNGDLYMYGVKVSGDQRKPINSFPCFICKKMLINAGIGRVIARTEDGKVKVFDVQKDWIEGWKKGDMLDDMDVYDAKHR
jgi:dCMP deaminase